MKDKFDLLHKANLSRLSEVAVPLNTQKQRVEQNEEMKYVLITRKKSKTLRKNLHEMQINNLPDREFKVRVINVLTKHWRRTDEYNESFHKEYKLPVIKGYDVQTVIIVNNCIQVIRKFLRL